MTPALPQQRTSDDPPVFCGACADVIHALEAERDRYREALEAIKGPCDSLPWIEPYRAAGGGYEGLQAIAAVALNGTTTPPRCAVPGEGVLFASPSANRTEQNTEFPPGTIGRTDGLTDDMGG